MITTRIFFKNAEGEKLAGYLELPFNQVPHNFAIFAHCFTCNKNFKAVKNICTSLTEKGFGVLRFDFTGLGESEGDFTDTNFSGNVEDLISAAEYLKENYRSPSLLIGHSLGGAAVLIATFKLPDVKAVATIGAPSTLSHVTHLLKEGLDEINREGAATINIGGRPFRIKKHFLQDLEDHKLQTKLNGINRALLILHSPQDKVVEVKNAEELYKAARHPKSFVSLDGADHLLTAKEDSLYAGTLIGSWAYRYLDHPEIPAPQSNHQVVAQLGEKGYTTYIRSGNHSFIADEPVSFGGNDYGPSPYDLLSAALASCTSMTLQMYARRKKWPLEKVETHVNHSKAHAKDCEDCESNAAKIDTFQRDITLTGKLDEKQKKRLLEIADKCPVHKTLHSDVEIINNLIG